MHWHVAILFLFPLVFTPYIYRIRIQTASSLFCLDVDFFYAETSSLFGSITNLSKKKLRIIVILVLVICPQHAQPSFFVKDRLSFSSSAVSWGDNHSFAFIELYCKLQTSSNSRAYIVVPWEAPFGSHHDLLYLLTSSGNWKVPVELIERRGSKVETHSGSPLLRLRASRGLDNVTWYWNAAFTILLPKSCKCIRIQY